VEQPGVTIDPDRAVVCLKGRRVRPERKLYLALHKPRDVVCTSTDPQGRKTCLDLVAGVPARVYTVGRLDRDSEGLILLTNDGDFAHALTHPRHQVRKRYRVTTSGVVSEEALARLRRGVVSRGETLNAERVERIEGGRPRYELVLCEGRNRQVRRMFEAVGADVVRLVRVRIGPLKLSGIRRGGWRKLAPAEVHALLAAASGPGAARGPSKGG
jgi:pseudouridine synthase